jgi:hypothetical protein
VEVLLFGRQNPKERASLDQRRDERELVFWTAREVLKLIVALVFVIYLLVSLLSGHDLILPGLSFWK